MPENNLIQTVSDDFRKYSVNIFDTSGREDGKHLADIINNHSIDAKYINRLINQNIPNHRNSALIVILADGYDLYYGAALSARLNNKSTKILIVLPSNQKMDTEIARKYKFTTLNDTNVDTISQSIIRLYEDEVADRYRAYTQRSTSKSKLNLSELADRIDLAADAISDLRINSTGQTVDELRSISNLIRSRPSLRTVPTGNAEASPEEFKSYLRKVLLCIHDLYKFIENSRMAAVIICGALSAINGCTGLSAPLFVGLTLAAWQGPEAFLAAINKLSLPKK